MRSALSIILQPRAGRNLVNLQTPWTCSRAVSSRRQFTRARHLKASTSDSSSTPCSASTSSPPLSPSASKAPRRSLAPQALLTFALCTTVSAITYYLISSSSSQKPQDKSSTTRLKPGEGPVYDLRPENIETVRKKMVALLGEEHVSTNLGERIAHSSTAWSPAPNGDFDRPSLTVYPSSTEEVSKIAKICHHHRIPMLPFAGGTSLEATLAAQNSEICIDFKRMSSLLSVSKASSDVTVQPGLGYQDLNRLLEEHDLFFPVDPGPGACIGGMIAQGCSGTNAYRYGTMREWVLGLTAVLADGTIIKTRHRPRKSAAGYDLTRLFVASEGTLGFVTEATLRVTIQPKNVRVAVASFNSIDRAVGSTIKIHEAGLQLEAMELLDATTMYAVNQGGYVDREWAEKPTIFFKFAGGSNKDVQKLMTKVEGLVKGSGSLEFTRAKTEEETQGLWEARKTALWSMLAIKRHPDDQFLSADVCVPIGNLAVCIEECQKLLDESGLIGSFLGHVGDGNFHTTVLYSAHEKDLARRVIRETQKIGVRMHGTVSGEHGIGLENRDALVYELGDGAIDAMRSIKSALDPLGLMNPGKIFRLKVDDAGKEKDASWVEEDEKSCA